MNYFVPFFFFFMEQENLLDHFFPAMSLFMLILQLLGNSYGLGNSMEFDTVTGGCILCLC